MEIENETKGTKWSHAKHFVGIPETKNNIITWSSCWKFREELQAGDCVSLTLLSDLHVTENSINFTYDYEPINEAGLLDQVLLGTTKYSGHLALSAAYDMFTYYRTLYRIEFS